MEKIFNPSNFEKKHYTNWMEKKYFKAEVNPDKKPFTIIMPPPNITSRLHIGHAYGVTIMDSITRYKRMQGFEALLLPGSDHAAIATEAKVVEKLKNQGLTKQDLGREKFMEEMQAWYDEYGAVINEQFQLVGISADWDRFAFTMDEPRSESVKKSFVELYNKGLIYQGNRITNWCVSCNTALSDIEVEYEENLGSLWHIKYNIKDSNESLVIATTRPETLLGDTAVAVNPTDERYSHLIGKFVILPLVNKEIPIIADDYVDAEFGTGVVKITPAHDPNDYEVGQRHNLPEITIMNNNGVINKDGGIYEGLERFEARKQIINDLNEAGLLVKTEKHNNKVGHCQRCNTIVEPMISKQWYVKMQELAKRAIKVVEDKEIKFIPQRFEKIYFNWMTNIKDWCISRQIWSGHRIPVFYEEGSDVPIVELEDPRTMKKYEGKKLIQDPDSLDTWFSSALWPFSTLGWPNQTKDLDYFFPTSLMITAYDIIFFWVARMIFSSLEYTDKIPFEEVLIHGLIRDAQGRKMSKSLGNGIDPIDIIDKYGTDAMRMSLLQGVGIGQDNKYSIDRPESSSNFLNKLWNASRFVLDNVSKINFTKIELKEEDLTLADKWILTELNEVIKYTEKDYDKYDLGMVITRMYEFVWTKFCDWYIESSKVKLYTGNDVEKNQVLNVLLHVLESILKMLHPIVPFVTEEIYLHLPNSQETIMLQDYPKFNKAHSFISDHKIYESIMGLIKQLRNLRSEMNIADNIRTDLFLMPYDNYELLSNNKEIVNKLAFGKEITIIKSESEVLGKTVEVINELAKLIIPTSELINFEEEKLRLQNELKTVESEIKRAESMLKNEGFVKRAPENLINAEKEKIEKYNSLKLKIIESINNLEN